MAIIALWVGSCAFSVAPTSSSQSTLTLELSAFPDRISVEDSTAQAEIWATVKQGNKPVRDSTVVVFATTVGQITAATITLDGLAVALLTSPGDGRPRQATIIAQALTVRDTLDINFIFVDK
jgi:hypothetical protein|tara:strand:- start:235 stop:600 length:366 start_codon:yes stop_codon:yes gene_type:complete